MLDDFKKGNYELGAQTSAVAIKKGASNNADFDMGVAVLTQTKGGLMFDVSLGGQKFTFEPRYVVLLMYTVTFNVHGDFPVNHLLILHL